MFKFGFARNILAGRDIFRVRRLNINALGFREPERGTKKET